MAKTENGGEQISDGLKKMSKGAAPRAIAIGSGFGKPYKKSTEVDPVDDRSH